MARSPGFYYNEVDNTAYLNNNIEAAKVGTTVAVIGYASKGEFNTPVEITSYSNFVKKFGEPIQDQYSGMAVKRILNNGGTVLFVRVGDDNALGSNVIIKNGNKEVKSKIVFNKSDVKNNEDGYDSGKTYIANLGNKLIKVKTSVDRGISRANLINSIKNSLKETKAYTEYKIENKQFSFNIVNSNDESVYGPYFVDLASAKTSSDREKALNNAIKNFANYYRIVVKNSNGALTAETNLTELGANSNYGFKVSNKEIIVALGEENTIGDLVTKVNKELQNAGLNNVVFKFVNDGENSYFLLYSKTGEDLNFEQYSSNDNVKPLFDNRLDINGIISEKYEEIKINGASDGLGINSVILKSDNTNKANDITFKYIDGTFVLESNTSTAPYYVEPTDYEFLDNVANYTTLILTENYSEALSKYTVREENKKIVITTDNTNKQELLPSELITEGNDEFVGNLLDLFVDDDIEYVIGKAAVPDEDRDMVKVSSVEKGSSTKGIVFEVVKNTNAFDGTITNDIYVRNGNNVESFLNVSFKEGDERYFVNVINQTAENGGSRLINVAIKRPENANPNTPVELNPGVYVLGQPKDKDSVISETASDDWDYDYQIGTNGIAATEEDAKTYFCGVLTLESDLANDDLYDFDILITPDCIEEEVQTAAIELCESTMGAIYIADTPIALSKEEAIKWHNGKGENRSSAINSTYAAVYWPWLKVYDDISGKNVYVMPSVLMAAQYVFTDKVGPWNAPAGTSYGSIPAIDIERYPNKLDRDDLYTNGNVINPFKKYNDGTILAFGEKTTQRIDSTLSKIHTRRTLIRIRKELKAVLNGFIFKQGIAENVKLMKAYATTILDKFKSNKAIATYRVDTSRNTTASMQQDIIYVDVFVTPVGCIEEVNISFTLDKGNETVN